MKTRVTITADTTIEAHQDVLTCLHVHRHVTACHEQGIAAPGVLDYLARGQGWTPERVARTADLARPVIYAQQALRRQLIP